MNSNKTAVYKIKEITVRLENAFGRELEVFTLLSDAGINLRSMDLSGENGDKKLRLIVSDDLEASRILQRNYIPASINNIVAVEIKDKPGSLTKLLTPIYDAGIKPDYMYAFVTRITVKAIMALRFGNDKCDTAIKIMLKNGYNLLKNENLGIQPQKKSIVIENTPMDYIR